MQDVPQAPHMQHRSASVVCGTAGPSGRIAQVHYATLDILQSLPDFYGSTLSVLPCQRCPFACPFARSLIESHTHTRTPSLTNSRMHSLPHARPQARTHSCLSCRCFPEIQHGAPCKGDRFKDAIGEIRKCRLNAACIRRALQKLGRQDERCILCVLDKTKKKKDGAQCFPAPKGQDSCHVKDVEDMEDILKQKCKGRGGLDQSCVEDEVLNNLSPDCGICVLRSALPIGLRLNLYCSTRACPQSPPVPC